MGDAFVATDSATTAPPPGRPRAGTAVPVSCAQPPKAPLLHRRNPSAIVVSAFAQELRRRLVIAVGGVCSHLDGLSDMCLSKCGACCVQGKSWGIGFAIPAVAMLLAVVIFVAGNGRYKHEKPTGSPLERVADITWHACGHSLRRLLCCGSAPQQEVVTPRSADVRPLGASALHVFPRHSTSIPIVLPPDFASAKRGPLHAL